MRRMRQRRKEEGEWLGAGWKPQGNADQMSREGGRVWGTICQMFAVWRSESCFSHPPKSPSPPSSVPWQDSLLRAWEDK